MKKSDEYRGIFEAVRDVLADIKENIAKKEQDLVDVHKELDTVKKQSIQNTINQSINQSIKRSINQSIKQPIDQAINQSINQSIDT